MVPPSVNFLFLFVFVEAELPGIENGTCTTARDHNLYSEELIETLLEYQQTGFLCDTVLVAEDGHVLAHSPVLAAASPVFKQSMSTGHVNVIMLPGIKLYIAKIAVCFAYTGKLVVPTWYMTQDNIVTIIAELTELGLKVDSRVLTKRYKMYSFSTWVFSIFH